MNFKLSKRLQRLADYVPQGSQVADIGTDHAYLPIYLIKNNISPMVVAGDINPGPIKTAKGQVEGYNLSNRILVRQGKGLGVLQPGEVETVIIAGMGGTTIIEILENQPIIVKKLKTLILQPMVASFQVREWLYSNGWNIIDEDLIEEDGRIYEIICANQGTMQVDNMVELHIGKKLLEKKHPLLLRFYEKEIKEEQEILQNIVKSSSETALKKAEEIKQRIIEIKKVIACHLNAKL